MGAGIGRAKKRLDDLTSPKRPEEKTPTGKPNEDAAHRLRGVRWAMVNVQQVREEIGRWCGEGYNWCATGRGQALMAEAEFKVLKEGLDLQKTALDRSLDDRFGLDPRLLRPQDADRATGH